MVDVKLGEPRSPKHIFSHIKADGQTTISHESIYQRIYAHKRAGGTLHCTLRCQKVRQKPHRKREMDVGNIRVNF